METLNGYFVGVDTQTKHVIECQINNNLNAIGKLIISNPEITFIYNGPINNGKMNGDGVITYIVNKSNPTFKSYEGSFVDDNFDGLGKISFLNGDIFVGSFTNNKKNGTGKLYNSNRDLVMDNVWKNDIICGKMEYVEYFHDSLNPKLIGTLFNSIKVGAWSYFREDKTIEKIDFYKEFDNSTIVEEQIIENKVSSLETHPNGKIKCQKLVEKNLSNDDLMLSNFEYCMNKLTINNIKYCPKSEEKSDDEIIIEKARKLYKILKTERFNKKSTLNQRTLKHISYHKLKKIFSKNNKKINHIFKPSVSEMQIMTEIVNKQEKLETKICEQIIKLKKKYKEIDEDIDDEIYEYEKKPKLMKEYESDNENGEVDKEKEEKEYESDNENEKIINEEIIEVDDDEEIEKKEKPKSKKEYESDDEEIEKEEKPKKIHKKMIKKSDVNKKSEIKIKLTKKIYDAQKLLQIALPIDKLSTDGLLLYLNEDGSKQKITEIINNVEYDKIIFIKENKQKRYLVNNNILSGNVIKQISTIFELNCNDGITLPMIYYEGEFDNTYKPDGNGSIYENGKIKYTGLFEKGILKSGTQFDEFGQENYMYYSGTFKNNIPDGEGILFNKNGKKIYEGQIQNNKRHGNGISYFENTGNKEWEGKWHNDHKHGKGILYDDNGTKICSCTFENDQIDQLL